MARVPAARWRPWSVTRACSGCRGDAGRPVAAPDALQLRSTTVEGCSSIGEHVGAPSRRRPRWRSPIGSGLLARHAQLICCTASAAWMASELLFAGRLTLQHHHASPHAACACSQSGSPLPVGVATAHTLSAAWQQHLVLISLAAHGRLWCLPGHPAVPVRPAAALTVHHSRRARRPKRRRLAHLGHHGAAFTPSWARCCWLVGRLQQWSTVKRAPGRGPPGQGTGPHAGHRRRRRTHASET